ncbi:PadR family transcriptional regulator [Amycolatopsis sp. NPDC059090]|uniref:PadR family transcriptional regulator n=1 Tax=unclassified Amycolatopsis TaxID=2618356 RepID=UPI00366AA349
MGAHKVNATEASLLGFLHAGPMTGWDLVAAAQQRIGAFWSLTQSQVYRELAAMSEGGLIEAGEQGSRARRPYRLTDAGRQAFEDWCGSELAAENIRFPLLLVVMFGRDVPGGRLAEIIAEHRKIHADRLAEYERSRAAVPEEERDPYAMATRDFGIRYERAVLEWFAALPDVITGNDRR